MAISPESLKILKLHFRRRLTDEQIAEEMNIDVKKVKTILAWYRRHPEEVNSTVTKGKEEEMKEQLIEMFKQGKSYQEMAAATGKTVKNVQAAISYYRKTGHSELTRRPGYGHKIAKDALGSTQPDKEVESPAKSPDLLPQAQEPQAFEASEPAPEPAIPDAAPLTDKAEPIPAPAVLPTPSTTGLDPSSIHSLIDIALKLKKDLLRYAEELETAALYIQSMAKEIREKMSA